MAEDLPAPWESEKPAARRARLRRARRAASRFRLLEEEIRENIAQKKCYRLEHVIQELGGAPAGMG